MADGNITVEVSTQAATAELRRLRAENAKQKLWPLLGYALKDRLHKEKV